MFSKTIIALTLAVAALAYPEAHPAIHKRMALIANAQASCGQSAAISCCNSASDTLIGLNCAEIPILNICEFSHSDSLVAEDARTNEVYTSERQ
jgi:hypothetical protein